MSTLQRVAAIAGIIAVLIVLWLVFAPVNDMSKEFTTNFVDNVTDNLTPIATENGTISAYNEFQGDLAGGLWFIIAGGILVIAIIAITNQNSRGE